MKKIKNFINDYIIEQVKYFFLSYETIQEEKWEKFDLHTIKFTKVKMLILVIIMIIPIINFTILNLIELNYIEVSAKVTKKVEIENSTRNKWFPRTSTGYRSTIRPSTPTYNGYEYQYTINGKTYTSTRYEALVMYSSGVVGSTRTIKVHPENYYKLSKITPNYFFEQYSGVYLIVIIAFLFLINEYFFLNKRDLKRALSGNNKTTYRYKGDTQSGAYITLPNHIKDVIELEDCVVILVDINDNVLTNNPRNVYCYNAKGELIWQIDPSNNMFGVKLDVDEYKFEKIAYQNNYLYVITGNIAFAIDVKTGVYRGHNFM